MIGSRLLFTASWAILLVLFVVVALLSANSLRMAYASEQDNLTPNFTLEDLRNAAERKGAESGVADLGREAVNAFKGRRVTAATWALGCALLALMVVLVPYRRGERWAWWALLVSIGLSQLLSLVRVLAFQSTFGTATPAVILAFALLGLMAGAPRLFSRNGEEI
jgi:hypothetical protein